MHVLRLCTYQHGSPQVKLVKECRHKDVTLHQFLCICLFHFSDGVGEPLELLLVTSHPDEVHLEGEEQRGVVHACAYTLHR